MKKVLVIGLVVLLVASVATLAWDEPLHDIGNPGPNYTPYDVNDDPDGDPLQESEENPVPDSPSTADPGVSQGGWRWVIVVCEEGSFLNPKSPIAGNRDCNCYGEGGPGNGFCDCGDCDCTCGDFGIYVLCECDCLLGIPANDPIYPESAWDDRPEF